MPGRFHRHQAILRAAQQLQQLLVAGAFSVTGVALSRIVPVSSTTATHVPFRRNIDTDKSQRTQNSSDARIQGTRQIDVKKIR
jgi:hypothetical protein